MTTTRTIGIGTKFRSSYHDANPMWEVQRSRGRGLWEAKIIDCPDYNGTVKVFLSKDILQATRFAKAMEAIGNQSAGFYESLKPGQVVHYHNGFGQYVRCQATKEQTLKPTALVGNWSPHDLPHRMLDGSISFPYYARKVLSGETLTPCASNIYECSPKGKQDPRSLKPLDLMVPEMTPHETVEAGLWAAVKAAKEALDPSEPGTQRDPRKRLEDALKAIHRVMPEFFATPGEGLRDF